MKLNQVIALVAGKKTSAKDKLTGIYKAVQKPDLFEGLERTYQPLDDEGDVLPPESKLIQLEVSEILYGICDAVSGMYDMVAAQDKANCGASSDVVVSGKVILKDVPVTYLMFLEKQLVDLRTLVSHIPTLDSSVKWEWNEGDGCHKGIPVKTNRSKKVRRRLSLAKATPEHPEQVESYNEDVKVGEWTNVRSSCAMKTTEKREMVEKIRMLIDAVKTARVDANSCDAKYVSYSGCIFNYIFDIPNSTKSGVD